MKLLTKLRKLYNDQVFESRLQSLYLKQERIKFQKPDVHELMYMHYFHEYSARLEWLQTRPYCRPVGGTANNSLLYFLVRFLNEFGPNRILEFGAGQTTKIISEYVKKHDVCAVTYESDATWAEQVNPNLNSHKVYYSPLVPVQVDGDVVRWYQGAPPTSKYDLIIVDGPAAYTKNERLNRLGAITWLEATIGLEFVIVIDDAVRTGERKLLKKILSYLDECNIVHKHTMLTGLNAQAIIATPKYYSALFF